VISDQFGNTALFRRAGGPLRVIFRPRPVPVMSASPLLADIAGPAAQVRKVLKGDITTSFDDVIGQLLKSRGHFETERLGSLEVDDELEFRWMLHW
jgi:hypothetical protein